MIKILENKYDKKDVVERYVEIITKSISKLDLDFIYISNIYDIKKNDIVITTNIDDAIKVLLLKRARVINWYQGIRPEESFIRNKSTLRKIILDYIEKFVLNNSLINIFVSYGMKEYYHDKYSFDKSNYFIMPCFNTKINNINKNKFNNENINFTYIGGLSKWQCIEETLKIYKEIENNNENVFLKFLTPDISEGKKLLEEYQIKNYEVKYVDNSLLSEELRNVKYGFLIRKEDPINYVSTPTKLSTYLSNGIIPITTKNIYDINKLMQDKEYKIFIDLNEDIKTIAKKIIDADKNIKDEENMITEYNNIFNEYYNEDNYIKQLSKCLHERII